METLIMIMWQIIEHPYHIHRGKNGRQNYNR